MQRKLLKEFRNGDGRSEKRLIMVVGNDVVTS